MVKKEKKKTVVLKGIPASPGIAIGLAFLLHRDDLQVEQERIADDAVEEEVDKFTRAVEQTKDELRNIRRRVAKNLGEERARIFDVQLLMLDDVMAFDETVEAIRSRKINAEFLFWENLEKAITAMESSDQAYFRERAADIRDLGRRVLHNLLGIKHLTISGIHSEVVVVSPDLSPTDTAQMHRPNILGFATDMGGRTSHVAIMARSLEIPAVVGLKQATRSVEHGEAIILDGNRGVLVIHPDERILKQYGDERKRYHQWAAELENLRDLPAETLDHQTIRLAANIEFPAEAESARSHGAKGIGLYRTEFLYLGRSDLPSEEEQYEAYRAIAEKMSPDGVTIRTFDLGGDKFTMAGESHAEANPFLGRRAIRLCLDHPDVFIAQLTAILRASACGNLKIIFPMISGVDQLRKAREMIQQVQADLKARGGGAFGRPGGRISGSGGRFLQHRDQRSGAVHPGRGPGQRAGGRPVRALSSGRHPAGQGSGRGGAPGSHSGGHLRGAVRRAPGYHASAGTGPGRVQHELHLHSADQKDHPLGDHGGGPPSGR